MRVLTVRQPWAWAIIHRGKDVENRVRSLGPYRGPVAIHAGLMGASFDAAHPDLWPFDERHVTGRVIGVVDLVGEHSASVIDGCGRMVHDCHEHGTCRHHCSPWALGPAPKGGWYHHLELANPRPLARPIPARGRLGLWRPDADLEAAIREQIGDQ